MSPQIFSTRIPAPIAPRQKLTIGLLNNMPDSAMAATERQFASLLGAAGADFDIELRLFSLTGVPRGERALAEMAGRYEGAKSLFDAKLDGLIVTGAEPRAADLDDEPYWPAFARVIEGVFAGRTPTVWSCLAAHAAVLHMDGIRRRLLPRKLSGVFVSEPAGDDPLTDGAWSPILTPHSRQNGLDEAELVDAGYQILTMSADAGVDAFARRDGGLALFLQGHPEYDADTLLREYGRDVGRFLRGQRGRHPMTPMHYFEAHIEAELDDLADIASRRPNPDLMESYTHILARATPMRRWRRSAVRLYRGWLDEVAGRERPPVTAAARWIQRSLA